jgi:ornithine cyclodeaminase
MESDCDLLVLCGRDVAAILTGVESRIVDVVERAYRAYGKGTSSLPHSTFLRFPDQPRNRIIALPGYVGDSFGIAGMKWIASFPGNLAAGLDRASAVIVLNSIETGRPYCLLEGSVISAKRTAASAALAARTLSRDTTHASVGLVGCGVINREVIRFLTSLDRGIERVYAFDIDRGRAQAFLDDLPVLAGRCDSQVAPSLTAVLEQCSLISFATTAPQPYVSDLSACAPGTIILHVSLRDIAPDCLLSCDNVTDDVDHVCREQTSLHLAERLVGHRRFIRCTLPDIIAGTAEPRSGGAPVVFSPFGLGVLDIALAKEVYDVAVRDRSGATIPSFLPVSAASHTTF